MRLRSRRLWNPRGAVRRGAERGFTLIETLIAMIVLIVGLVAVSHLILMATSSNAIANRTTVATSLASLQMERLMTTPFNSLTEGGAVEGGDPGASGDYALVEEVGGSAGVYFTRWAITDMGDGLVCIRVRTQARGAFSDLTRAELTTFRSLNAQPEASGSPSASATATP
jgi:type II secretory pathway pseudopilin PulG